MQSLLTTLLIADSVLIIIAVMMQPSKQQDALSALSGGSMDPSGHTKSRGFEASWKRSRWFWVWSSSGWPLRWHTLLRTK